MGDFNKYFEDKQFVRWVLNPDSKLNAYWDRYLRENPSERKQIELSRFVLSQLKSKREDFNNEEADRLYSRIVLELKRKGEGHNGRRQLLTFFKYTAALLLLITIGTTYYFLRTDSIPDYYSNGDFAAGEDAKLILSDGNQITLNEKESLIEHTEDGKVVINDMDTIREKVSVSEMNQLTMPFGKNSSIKFPDGTVAFLNAGSTLLYPAHFHRNRREVILYGEAYFEVIPNPERPFVVRTSHISVTALGTSFNLSAYPTDNMVETVLVEGKVLVSENKVKMHSRDIVLNPNEMASFDTESSETKVSRVIVQNHVAWHLGFLNFESHSLERIIMQLERYYDIHIKLASPELSKKLISGKLVLKEEKENVLEVLASTAETTLIKIDKNTFELR